MLSSSSSVFDTLPTRPPTPPREIANAVEDAITFLDDSNEVEKALKQTSTLKGSDSASSARSNPASQETVTSSNSAKRVGFTPHPTYHQIARTGQLSSPSAQIRKRAPSVKDSKPLKSILKPSTQPPPLTPDDLDSKLCYFSPNEPGSFAKMLQSAIQQLTGASVAGRLDAYLALNGALKAYEDVPDANALVAKTGLLMQFLTRDMAWKSASGALDTNIITQAVKLTATMIFDRRLSAALDDDFRTFVIDRSVAVIEHAEMPKALVKSHMFVLAQQRFGAPLMTPGRADKIITLLKSVDERCSGNTVIATRLVIYQRLLEQQPSVMLQRTRDWFDLVVHGMLSSIKEVRIRAIEAATLAGLTLGTQPYATKAVLDLFQSEIEEGQSFCDYLDLRLTQMVAEKEAGASVPQIWSAIVLFFRNKRFPAEKWPKFKSWLKLIQRCLNSSDLTIRYHAHHAWNRLVFVVMPDASTSRSMLGILKVPATSGMDRRGSDKHAKQIRQFALDTYYNLLHYSLRPGLSHEELDTAWDAFVDPVLSGMIKANAKGRHLACGIIWGLCSASPGIWNANAANEPAAIQPEDLPRLDPKWVRSRFAKIMTFMQSVLMAVAYTPESDGAAVEGAWRALMQSLADAGRQEIKTSSDLKEAIAIIVSICRSLWQTRLEPAAGTNAAVLARRYASVLSVAMGMIGAGPFAEDFLAINRDDGIQVASTPSHRHSKHHSAPQSPFVFLFGLLYQPTTWIQQSEGAAILASQILELQLSSRSSAQAKVDLLARSLQVWSAGYASDADPHVAACLWQCIARIARTVLGTPFTLTESGESQSLGLGLRHASMILNQGLKHIVSADAVQETTLELYDAILLTARNGAGIGGTIVAVVEPFAKAVHDDASSLSESARVLITSHVISTAHWPRSRQELDQAKKALWGVGLAPHKASAFDPYDHLYSLLDDELRHAYDDVKTLQRPSSPSAWNLLETCVSFLTRCPLSLRAVAIRKTQDGFAYWIADGARKTAFDLAIASQVISTWRDLVRLMESLPQKDSTLLMALEPLLVAALTSPHRVIVNEMILFWNNTFGTCDELEYPPELAKILHARSVDAEIALPTFPVDEVEGDQTILPPFYESQTQQPQNQERPRTSEDKASHAIERVPATAPVARSSHFPSKGTTKAAGIQAASGVRISRPKQPTPKARLRHDDSQIDFAPIESSPAPPVGESQLTEHQREVKAKQHQDAQMFPNLSSSPVVRSSAATARMPKRLDFAYHDHAGTPEQLPDAGVLMSDDVPSSPTPSSNKDADSAQIAMDDDEMIEDEEVQDPPSSPPSQRDEPRQSSLRAGIEEEANALFGDADGPDRPVDEMPKPKQAREDQRDLEQAPGQGYRDSDLPSDTLLPNEQLQLEAQQAVAENKLGDTTEGTTVYPQAQRSGSTQTSDLAGDTASVDQSKVDETVVPEVTRIENSFVELPPPLDEDHEDRESKSQESQRSTRKRKRSSEVVRTAKKRKQQSPLKVITGFFSSFVGGNQKQQDQDDDDMEEEIVVMHSLPSSSPAKAEEPRKAASPIVAVPLLSVQGVAATSEGEQAAAEPQLKRRRGRPRKSETPTSTTSQSQSQSQPQTQSQSQSCQTRSLKRKAPKLDDSASSQEPSPSFVQDTPAPPKARKQREKSQLVRAARLSQNETDAGRSTRQTHAASSHQSQDEQNDEDVDTKGAVEASQGTLQRQLLDGTIAARSDERAIASPRSILGRLKDVLADLPRIILGPQEEREMDDVLFEIRREVHEASRRGRV